MRLDRNSQSRQHRVQHEHALSGRHLDLTLLSSLRLIARTIKFIMSRPPIELLPPELLAHVFDNLAKECRAIQNVRLVCKVF
jgi:hypothetical protein